MNPHLANAPLVAAHPARPLPFTRPLMFALAGLAVAALWAYGSTLVDIVDRWNSDPQYSHGFLVPGFAAYLLWSRRAQFGLSLDRFNYVGLGILAVAMLLRLAGARYHYAALDQASILPCALGLVVLAGGQAALRWSWPAIGFLVFMIPLPHTLSLALSGPMQTFATNISTFLLQMLGRPALAEGNKILLDEIELGIVEACSGLRMLVVFFALSSAVALLIRKPLWERLVIAASAIPIALASNVLRITATGLFYEMFGNNFGGHLFHDIAGWLMMPLGLGFLGLELWILGKLLIEPSTSKPMSSTITLQRVETGSAGLYSRGSAPRREKWTAPANATTETPADEAPAASS